MIAHRLSAFTLFRQPGKGWQMSVRREGEAGWDVKIVPDEQAAAVLSMLETSGHPDGPWTVKPPLSIAYHKELPDDATGDDVARAFLSAGMGGLVSVKPLDRQSVDQGGLVSVKPLDRQSVDQGLTTELTQLGEACRRLTGVLNGLA